VISNAVIPVLARNNVVPTRNSFVLVVEMHVIEQVSIESVTLNEAHYLEDGVKGMTDTASMRGLVERSHA
jgi:hypothetical protein